jgi:hypothetical protein
MGVMLRSGIYFVKDGISEKLDLLVIPKEFTCMIPYMMSSMNELLISKL